jgi:integrase
MTVFKRGSSWVAKVSRNGEWEWVGTFPTKKEARAAEQEAMPRAGTYRLSVDQLADLWLRDYARPEASSQRNYRYALKRLRADFGSRRVASIDRPEAQAWARRVPYFAYRVARTMYADAMRDGFVPLNPFAQLRIPVPEGRKHIDVLDEAQVQGLADKALELFDEHFAPTIRALILVAGFAGLRPAELAELDWSDVDLVSNRLHIRHATGGDGKRKGPKTEAGRRPCVLPPPAREALAALERHAGTQAVFVNKGSVHRYFDKVRCAYGRPDVTPYWLRHACATLLLERGLSPEDVAKQLGHKDGGQLVRRLYGHPDEARQLDRIAMAFADVPEPEEVAHG